MSSQQSISSRPDSGRGEQHDLSRARKNLDESTRMFREMILGEKGRTATQVTPKKEGSRIVTGPSNIPPHLWNIPTPTTLASQDGNRNSRPDSAASNGNTTKTSGLRNASTSATTIGQSAGRVYDMEAGPRENTGSADTSDEQCTTSPEGGIRLSATSSDSQSPDRTRPSLSPMEPMAARYPQLAASRHATPETSGVPRLGIGWRAPAYRLAKFTSHATENPAARRAPQHEPTIAVVETEPKVPVIQVQKSSSPRHMSSRESVTSFSISDDGVGSPMNEENVRRKDIRGEIDMEKDIARYSERMADMSWEDLINSDWCDETLSFTRRFIMDWVKDTPDKIHTTFLEDVHEDHFLHDIDTNTGNLLAQVAQPYTATPEPLEERLRWRQFNMTSSLLERQPDPKMVKKVKRDERKDREIEQRAWIQIPRPLPVAEVDPRAPKVSIHLCPADPDHMAGCLEIYNQEITSGDQAIDTAPLCLEDFEGIFTRCIEQRTPFIVAIEGTSKEALLPQEDAAAAAVTNPFYEYASSVDKVVGFGFVSLCERGLAEGHVDVTGRFCGQLRVFVRQEYRRKGIGRVLLDKLMYICSDIIPLLDCYEWLLAPPSHLECQMGVDQVYKSGHDQIRGYMYLFVDVFYKDGDEKTVPWQAKLLGEYRFKRAATFEKLHYSEAYPNYVAKTKAVYMHCCRLFGIPRELKKPTTWRFDQL